MWKRLTKRDLPHYLVARRLLTERLTIRCYYPAMGASKEVWHLVQPATGPREKIYPTMCHTMIRRGWIKETHREEREGELKWIDYELTSAGEELAHLLNPYTKQAA